MMYDLPTSLVVCGTEYEIESDYRAILDIFTLLSDRELSNEEKTIGMLGIFYKDFFNMPTEHFGEAIDKCFDFINGGNAEEKKKEPKLMDWEQDFRFIIAPINNVAGTEVRSLKYLHWWTFLSYYYEIGDCFFAQIVRIRELKAKGKLKDKQDMEFYKKNKDVIDFHTNYTDLENEIVSNWT